jgi:SAM-dependent methyltransferase
VPLGSIWFDVPMDQYGPETYGERVADVYDEWYRPPNTRGEVALLTDLATGGPALELGIGTGRVALPLAANGVEVHGLDSSPRMIEQLRLKPGGDRIPVVVGDMAEVPVEGHFSLVYVVFNTFFMLTSQDAQVRCFRNVAAHLPAGGRFVIHAFVPDTSRIERGHDLGVREVGIDRVRLDATIYDSAAQRLDTTQVRITEQGVRFVHAKLRFAFPPELDLMAQLAGLQLESRWGSFDCQPFDAGSAFAVSVFRRP